jgi:drug/metabolite transporter (DMT)-like permease
MALDSLIVLSVVFGLASMLAYGIIDYMGSILTKKDNAIRITFWYFLISSALLAVIGLLFFRPPQISLLDSFVFAVLSVISVFAFLAFYKGLRIGKVSVVAPVASSWSWIAVLVGVLFLNEAVTPFLGLGIVLTILGTILTSFKFKDLANLNFKKSMPGVRYAVATMFGWGVLYTAIGIISRQLGWFWPILVVSVGSTIVLFVYALVSKTETSFPTKLTGLMFWYIIIGTAAFLFYSLGTSKGYVSLVGPISAAAPFVTVVLARVLVKERVDANQVVGIACIILGLVVLAY